MRTKTKFVLTIVGWLAALAPAVAADYRIFFRGSEAIAVESANLAPGRPAGYLGAAHAAPGNLGTSCPTCVPGGSSSPFYGAGTPNQIVTFLHPYTNKAVTVPLTLPVGKPTVVIKRDRVVYNYGLFGYKVVVKFHPDGRVEVRYDD